MTPDPEDETTQDQDDALHSKGKKWGKGGHHKGGHHHHGGGGKCNGGGGGSDKVEICHIPPGNPANAHTITVSKSAVDAHLSHGDALGACPWDDDGDDGGVDPEGGDGGGGGSSGTGGGAPVCAAEGAACSATGDCCTGVCGGSGICTSTCNPIADGPGSTCSESMDCCSGAACIQGLCYSGTTCKLEGTACNPDPESGDWCCFGTVCVDDGSGVSGNCKAWP